MRRRSLLALLLVAGYLACGDCWAADLPATQSVRPQPRDVRQSRVQQALLVANAPARTVEMVIDYGDGVQVRFTALAWREKMTVLDAVTAASVHPHGVKCVWRGSGSTAFLTQIGDVKNEGGGEKSRNWLFSLNDKESEVGIGACTLQAGDVVLWRFGTPDNNNN